MPLTAEGWKQQNGAGLSAGQAFLRGEDDDDDETMNVKDGANIHYGRGVRTVQDSLSSY